MATFEISHASTLIPREARNKAFDPFPQAFFYQNDIKTKLSSKLEKLGSVVFQTELGTYLDKANRISELASYIGGKLKASEEMASRAALLAKVDLVTHMVGEFPDLQGVMGGYYAQIDAEPDEVIKGISQHYRPIISGGDLPEGSVASSVALSDKIDTLTGLFGIGQPPTGSSDPFALRRQSLGIIRICIENELYLDIDDCLNKSAEIYGTGFSIDAVKNYIIDRLGSYYGDLGFGKDIVEAGIAGQAMSTNLLKLNTVIRGIYDFQTSTRAEKIISSNKRVANLLKKVNLKSLPLKFDRALATETAEIELHLSVRDLDLSTADAISEQLGALANLQAPIDKFFNQVMVMHDDLYIRNNRLALVRDLRLKFLEVADFSLIQ